MFSWVFQAHLGLQEPDPRVLRLTWSTGVAPWNLSCSLDSLGVAHRATVWKLTYGNKDDQALEACIEVLEAYLKP